MSTRTMAIMLAAMALVLAANDREKPDPDFSYSYPPQVRAIPALRAKLDADAAKLRADFVSGENEDRTTQRKGGFPFNPWSASYKWQVVTDTPRFLSLSSEQWEYSGGAHGNTEYDAILWDRTARSERDPKTLFSDPTAFAAAARGAFCKQLNAQRSEKRGGQPVGLKEFDQCDKPFGTIILGSSTRDRFDRIGFLIAPYDAGPYVEGTYEVTLPVTPAILATVKPEWRRYFRATGAP